MFLPEDKLVGSSLGPRCADFARGFGRLPGEPCAFANDGFPLEWDDETAKAQLLAYVDRFSSDLLAASLDGKPMPRRAPQDGDPEAYAVHRFALGLTEPSGAVRPPRWAGQKGGCSPDALHHKVATGNQRSLKGLQVYVDGPVLLYLTSSTTAT